MKRWLQMLLAWFLFAVYLLIGAFLFRYIELPYEKAADEKLLQVANEFLDAHPCVSKSDLHQYNLNVADALKSGKLDLHSEESLYSVTGSANAGESREVWDLPNSFFFSAAIVTTIGYGDLTPHSSLGRITCMIYGIIGLPLTAWVIGVIARSLTVYWAKALDKTTRFLACIQSVRFRKAIIIFVTILVLYFFLLQIPALVLGFVENWDTMSSVYYCFITLTTIGFGDLVVGNHPDFAVWQKWMLKTGMVAYVMLGLGLLVALSSAISERANKTVRKTFVPGNKYDMSNTASKKTRARMSRCLENEIALTYIPNLSAARKRPSGSSTNDLDSVVSMERQSPGKRANNDGPPCYDEVIIDLPLSDSTSCSKPCNNGQNCSEFSLPELSMHRIPLDSGKHTGMNGEISVISASECADGHFDIT